MCVCVRVCGGSLFPGHYQILWRFFSTAVTKSESGNEARCGEKGRKGCTRGEGHFLIMYQVCV